MISQGFKDRIDVVDIEMSQFQDRNGLWAKDMQYCTNVYILFADGHAVNMTPEDFKTLPADQQALIRHARSSPAFP